MATIGARILDLLSEGALTDAQIAQRLGVGHQSANATARMLAQQGRLVRTERAAGGIANVLVDGDATDEPDVEVEPVGGLITEDEVKAAVEALLIGEGYDDVAVAWGRSPGADVVATHPDRPRLILEAKGHVVRQAQNHNYFVGALGELVQRMVDEDTQYGLALPDNPQYRGLVQRLPTLVWDRLNFVVVWVKRVDGAVVASWHRRPRIGDGPPA